MMRVRQSLSLPQRSLALLLVGAFASGCIIAADDDGDDVNQGSTGDDDDGNGPSGPNTSGDDETVGDDGTDAGTTADDGDPPATTGGDPTGQCGDNLAADPGFELGTTNSPWEQASELYETPICNEDCSTDPGAQPNSGSWWVWFGGFEEPDTAFVAQTVTLSGDEAFVRFYLEINAAAGNGDDVFEVKVDDTTVFMVTDAEIDDFDNYREVWINVSDYADGADHRISFEGSLTGAGITNFFLDDVDIFTCEVDDETSSTGTAGDDSTTGTGTESGTETSDTDTDTDTDTDGTEGTTGG